MEALRFSVGLGYTDANARFQNLTIWFASRLHDALISTNFAVFFSPSALKSSSWQLSIIQLFRILFVQRT